MINEPNIEANDNKFDQLAKLVKEHSKEKILIFSEYADTVKYLFRRLQIEFPKLDKEIEVVYSEKASKKDQNKIVCRFAPIANEVLSRSMFGVEGSKKLEPINLLVSTDVISEGTDMQDAGIVICYDFHWNLSRLIQRAGRIDRIGQKREIIKLINFLPDPKLDVKLRLAEKVRANIEIWQKVIGDDAPVLEPTERADPENGNLLYAKKDSTILDRVLDENLFKADTLEKKLVDIEKMDEEYYTRIRQMQDGMRTASKKDRTIIGDNPIIVVALQAGSFRRYYKIDLKKNISVITWPDMEKYLEEDKNVKRIALPENYNEYIHVARKEFEKEFKNYSAGPKQKAGTVEQRWLTGELNKMLGDSKLKNQHGNISWLIKIFKPKIEDQWLIQDLRHLKYQHSSLAISNLKLLEQITDLTHSTAKRLVKMEEEGIEEKQEVIQILYSKYLESK